MKKMLTLLLCLFLIYGNAQKIKTQNLGIEKRTRITEGGSVQMSVRWGWKNIWPFCHKDGLFCRKVQKANKEPDIDQLIVDETINTIDIEQISENKILIKSMRIAGNVSDELVKKFEEKAIPIETNELSLDGLKPYFSKMNMEIQSEPVVFTPENQRYEVDIVKENGKSMKVIKVYQQSKININNKPFILNIITSSRKF